jgi:hypothetical protein
MPIAVDGSNLLHFLGTNRTEVRRQSLDLARKEGLRLTVVFDGPPPDGTPARESLGAVTVVWSEGRSADDVIVELLPRGAAASDWTVVTDDRGLGGRVRACGAKLRSLKAWAAKLRRVTPEATNRDRQLSAEEVAEWEAFFQRRQGPSD